MAMGNVLISVRLSFVVFLVLAKCTFLDLLQSEHLHSQVSYLLQYIFQTNVNVCLHFLFPKGGVIWVVKSGVIWVGELIGVEWVDSHPCP